MGRGHADPPATRRAHRAHAAAVRRPPHTGRAARGALGFRARHLRPLRLWDLCAGGGDGGLSCRLRVPRRSLARRAPFACLRKRRRVNCSRLSSSAHAASATECSRGRRCGGTAASRTPSTGVMARARSTTSSSSSAGRARPSPCTGCKSKWERGMSQSELVLVDAIATSAEATRELWRYLFGVSLDREGFTVELRPVDAALPHGEGRTPPSAPAHGTVSGCGSSTSARRCGGARMKATTLSCSR